MTEGKIAVCPQCGKKFKLKEGFSAASFSCTACGATVWVEGKPPAPSGGKRRSGAGAGAGARKGRGAVRSRGGRGRTAPTRGRHTHEEGDEEQEGRGRYSSRKKNNSTNMIIAVVGVVVLAAIVVLIMTKDKGGEPQQHQAAAPDKAPEGVLGTEENPIDPEPGSGIPVDNQTPGTNQPSGEGTPAAEGGPDTEQGSEEDGNTIGEKAPTEPTKKLSGGDTKKKKGGIRKSKYDPPTDIPHLESTPPDLREKIDNYIAAMFDPWAGRDSTDAKYELINIGKPAFPRILAKMASVRDTITDVDNDDERLVESSLKLADETLREMDGYLTSHTKPVLRPGSEKKYIAYICRLHYKRWVTALKDMPEMPGPYDPAQEYGDKPAEMD